MVFNGVLRMATDFRIALLGDRSKKQSKMDPENILHQTCPPEIQEMVHTFFTE